MFATFLVDVAETLVLGGETELLVKPCGETFAVGFSGIEVSSRTTISFSPRWEVSQQLGTRGRSLTACRRRWRLAEQERAGTHGPKLLAENGTMYQADLDHHDGIDRSPDTALFVLLLETGDTGWHRSVLFRLGLTLPASQAQLVNRQRL